MHIRQHNPTDHSHTCSICNKTLSSASSLDRHMLIHSGERPFKCKICYMAFTTNGNMHRHMRTHGLDATAAAAVGASLADVTRSALPAGSVGSSKRAPSRKSSSSSTNNHNNGNSSHNNSFSINNNVSNGNVNHCNGSSNGEASSSSAHSTGGNINTTTSRNNNNAFPGFFDLTFTDFSSKKFPLVAQNFCDEIARTSLTPFQEYECTTCHHSFPTPIALDIHCLTHGHFNFGKESNNNNTNTRNSYIPSGEDCKVKSDKLKLKQSDSLNNNNNNNNNNNTNTNSSSNNNGSTFNLCPICQVDCGSLEELVKHIFHHKLEGISAHGSQVTPDSASPWAVALANDKDCFMALLQLHNREFLSKSASLLNSHFNLMKDEESMNEKVDQGQQVSSNLPKQMKRSASPVNSCTIGGGSSQNNCNKNRVKLLTSPSYTEDYTDEDDTNMDIEDDNTLDDSSSVHHGKTKDGKHFSQVNNMSQKVATPHTSYASSLACNNNTSHLQPQSDLATIESIISIKNPLKSNTSIHINNSPDHSNASFDYEDEDEMIIDDAHGVNDDDGEDDVSNDYSGNDSGTGGGGNSRDRVKGLQSLGHGEYANASDKLSPVSFSSSNGSLESKCKSSSMSDANSGPVSCSICKAEFKSVCALRKHSRSHVQGGHNYQCHLCPYTSLDKSTLVRHLRTHNGERPFKCSICKFAFTTKSNCERHIRKRHKKTSKNEIRASITFSIETAPSLRNPDSQLTSSNLINHTLNSGLKSAYQMPSLATAATSNAAFRKQAAAAAAAAAAATASASFRESASPFPLSLVPPSSPLAAVNLIKKLTTGAPLDLTVHALDLSMKDHQQQQQQQQQQQEKQKRQQASTGHGFPLSLSNLQQIQRLPLSGAKTSAHCKCTKETANPTKKAHLTM